MDFVDVSLTLIPISGTPWLPFYIFSIDDFLIKSFCMEYSLLGSPFEELFFCFLFYFHVVTFLLVFVELVLTRKPFSSVSSVV